MAAIENIRVVLLTGIYGHAESRETRAFCQSGQRTTGMVEVTLANGTTGLGEGYLAVFAPAIFTELVSFLVPRLIGRDAGDVAGRVRELRSAADYWGLQGPMRHAIAAIEIALVDANAKVQGVPAWQWLGGSRTAALPLYASGGDASTPAAMTRELDRTVELGIPLFKMRVRGGMADVGRTVWTLEEGAKRGLRVGADMSQNLGQQPQSAAEALAYLDEVHRHTGERIDFLEEAVGPLDLDGFRKLRAASVTRIAGGETLTTPEEMCQRIATGVYDIAQPDAAVMGLSSIWDVCAAARSYGCTAAVHAWGGPVSLMANYHAALAAGGMLAEVPMLDYPLRERMYAEPLGIEAGKLLLPRTPGLGVVLTPEMEAEFAFNPRAVYSTPGVLPPEDEAAWTTPAIPRGSVSVRSNSW